VVKAGKADFDNAAAGVTHGRIETSSPAGPAVRQVAAGELAAVAAPRLAAQPAAAGIAALCSPAADVNPALVVLVRAVCDKPRARLFLLRSIDTPRATSEHSRGVEGRGGSSRRRRARRVVGM
jgi:hypothetical protein